MYKIAGILVSILFVYLAVRKVDLSESLRILGTFHPGWLLAGMAVYLCGFPFRALRWRRILWHQKALSMRQIIVPVLVGHMANNVLPARTGEIYRAHFLGRRASMSRSGAVGSIVVERALDGMMLVAMMLSVLFLFPEAGFLNVAALFIGLVFVLLMAGIIFYGSAASGTHRRVDRLLGLLPGSLERFAGARLKFFLSGIQGASTVSGRVETVVYTVLIWAFEAGAIALVIVSFDVSIPLVGYLLVFVLAALGTTLPSGPGYIGPYQYAFVLGLSFFAVSRETALAVSVASQLALLGSITVIGLALLWREQLRSTALPNKRKPETEGESKPADRSNAAKSAPRGR